MIEPEQLQGLFLKWMEHWGIRSWEQIKGACSDLAQAYNIPLPNVLAAVFYPLFRTGIIEFAGEGKYARTLPCLVYNKPENRGIAVNVPENMKAEIAAKYKVYGESPGLFRLVAGKEEIRKLGQEWNVRTSPVEVLPMLSQYPVLENVIKSFEKREVVLKYRYCSHRFAWDWVMESENLKPGRYKTSNEDGTREYFAGFDKECYEIPARQWNSEAMNVVECYLALYEQRLTVEYEQKKQELVFQGTRYLPVTLERLLRLASLHLEKGVVEARKNIRFSCITPKMCTQVERILGYAVSIL